MKHTKKRKPREYWFCFLRPGHRKVISVTFQEPMHKHPLDEWIKVREVLPRRKK